MRMIRRFFSIIFMVLAIPFFAVFAFAASVALFFLAFAVGFAFAFLWLWIGSIKNIVKKFEEFREEKKEVVEK